MQQALDAVFGGEDARLRQIIVLTYLTPGIGESTILAEIHLSRATYYRQLREARARLAQVPFG